MPSRCEAVGLRWIALMACGWLGRCVDDLGIFGSFFFWFWGGEGMKDGRFLPNGFFWN